jgi:hypothetical protein
MAYLIYEPENGITIDSMKLKIDTSHLDAIRIRLSNERSRLKVSSSDSERKFRSVCITGIERELAGELDFLGLPPDLKINDIDDDALLAELTL